MPHSSPDLTQAITFDVPTRSNRAVSRTVRPAAWIGSDTDGLPLLTLSRQTAIDGGQVLRLPFGDAQQPAEPIRLGPQIDEALANGVRVGNGIDDRRGVHGRCLCRCRTNRGKRNPAEERFLCLRCVVTLPVT